VSTPAKKRKAGRINCSGRPTNYNSFKEWYSVSRLSKALPFDSNFMGWGYLL